MRNARKYMKEKKVPRLGSVGGGKGGEGEGGGEGREGILSDDRLDKGIERLPPHPIYKKKQKVIWKLGEGGRKSWKERPRWRRYKGIKKDIKKERLKEIQLKIKERNL